MKYQAQDKNNSINNKGSGSGASKRGLGRWRKVRRALILITLAVFIGAFIRTSYILKQYKDGEDFYTDAVEKYTVSSSHPKAARPPVPAIADDITVSVRQQAPRSDECAPITVDFEALHAVNPDIIGWIYCPGTVINYPVLYGEDNDEYLHTRFDGRYLVAGSIFIDAANEPDFSDYNTIFYGHHMSDKSMFAILERWQQQDFFDEHPVIWLLTPEQDYKILLFSAYNISAYSDAYTIYKECGDAFDGFLEDARENSQVHSDAELYTGANYVMLSTCAYAFANARSVVHGMLQPAGSASGTPFEPAE